MRFLCGGSSQLLKTDTVSTFKSSNFPFLIDSIRNCWRQSGTWKPKVFKWLLNSRNPSPINVVEEPSSTQGLLCNLYDQGQDGRCQREGSQTNLWSAFWPKRCIIYSVGRLASVVIFTKVDWEAKVLTMSTGVQVPSLNSEFRLGTTSARHHVNFHYCL